MLYKFQKGNLVWESDKDLGLKLAEDGIIHIHGVVATANNASMCLMDWNYSLLQYQEGTSRAQEAQGGPWIKLQPASGNSI